MLIFFTLDFFMLIAMLFGAIGLGYSFISAMSSIWWAIFILAIPIGVIIMCLYRIKNALNNKPEGFDGCLYIPIYLFVGITSVLFFESSIATFFPENIDTCLWFSPICAILFIEFLVGIEKLFAHIKKPKLGVLVSIAATLLIVTVVMLSAYSRFKQDVKKFLTDDAEVFIVNTDCNPYVELRVKNKSGTEIVGFPFGLFDVKYPLAQFKQGASVVGIDGALHTCYINGTDYILVYDLENDIAGYVPPETLAVAKKRMYVVEESSPIYAIERGEKELISPSGQRGTIESDVVSETIIGELSVDTPVEWIGSIGYTGENSKEFKYARIRLDDGTEGCVLSDNLQPVLISVD